VLSFREVDVADAEMILRWRTQPRVAEMMMTKVSDDIDDQRRWLMSSFESPTYYHWIMQNDGRDVGFVSVSQIDREHGTASWGLYVGSDADLGIGAAVPAYFYNYLFAQPLGVKIITAEVLEINQTVVRMHAIFGYERTPESDFDVIVEGETKRMLTMTLSREKWAQQKRFHSFRANFPTAKWLNKRFSALDVSV
jgi:RimJ/RimL family protein N-acetyltransferase